MDSKIIWTQWTLSQKMRNSTYEINHYGDKDFQTVTPHSHDFYELYYFIGGRASYIVENKKYQLRHGDLLLIPPGELHQLDMTDSSQLYERIVLWITPRYLRALGTRRTDLTECFRLCAESRAYLIRDISFAEKIGTWLDEAFTLSAASRYGDDLCAEILLKNIFLELCRYTRSRRAPESGISHAAITQAIDYIAAHLTDDLSLDALADQLYLNKYYLARLFREQTNVTIHQYILKKRLSLARSFIEHGLPIAQVCQRSGFHDYTNFFRAFKNEYGMTPGQYHALYGGQPSPPKDAGQP